MVVYLGCYELILFEHAYLEGVVTHESMGATETVRQLGLEIVVPIDNGIRLKRRQEGSQDVFFAIPPDVVSGAKTRGQERDRLRRNFSFHRHDAPLRIGAIDEENPEKLPRSLRTCGLTAHKAAKDLF